MKNKLNANGTLKSSLKVNFKVINVYSPFFNIIRLIKRELEDTVSRIHMLFFKNIYPSIKH